MPIVNADIDSTAVIRFPDLVNIYGCRIGAETSVGPFVEIQQDAEIGARCKIQSHAFICSGVAIEDGVFVGHGVMFVNDRYPRAVNDDGVPERAGEWKLEKTRVCRGATLGSNATIMCGVTVGAGALVGAGAVVTKDVPPDCVAVGVPAQIIAENCAERRRQSRGQDC
ncbi:N-acetyltransferase [bacterium]|nr:N-acetyltransferase [bacterium]